MLYQTIELTKDCELWVSGRTICRINVRPFMLYQTIELTKDCELLVHDGQYVG